MSFCSEFTMDLKWHYTNQTIDGVTILYRYIMLNLNTWPDVTVRQPITLLSISISALKKVWETCKQFWAYKLWILAV